MSDAITKDLIKKIERLERELERVSKKAAVAKNDFAATSAPGVNDDVNAGYARGSIKINVNTNNIYMCANPAAGAAVWRLLN